ncbi:MAG: CoA-binding protein [Planctomycetota bacterium]
MHTLIEDFLSEGPYAVVGASRNRHKYGNKCLRCYQQAGKEAIPINPQSDEIEGLKAYPSLSDAPKVRAISVITPPEVTAEVLREAAELGIRYAWLQPGAESSEAYAAVEDTDINLIAGGPCLLVALGYREF